MPVDAKTFRDRAGINGTRSVIWLLVLAVTLVSSIGLRAEGEWEITAESDDGVIQGVQHRELPIHGVQFHPESIASEHGHKLIQNFLDIAREKVAA